MNVEWVGKEEVKGGRFGRWGAGGGWRRSGVPPLGEWREDVRTMGSASRLGSLALPSWAFHPLTIRWAARRCPSVTQAVGRVLGVVRRRWQGSSRWVGGFAGAAAP